MGVKEKIAYVEPTSWLTENMTEEEIQEIVTKAKEKAKKRIIIYDALDSLRDFDIYSPYQKDLSTVIDYIEELEKEIEDLKEAKAIYVERPKTMQEKQAESEKYEKAFDDGYENGYAQARFDYGQQPCEDWKFYYNHGYAQAKRDLLCDDCVSRQALIDKATSWDTHFTDSEKVVSLTDIMSLPSVKPQRPKGEWIPIHPLQEDDDGAYMCSCCRVGNWGIDPKVDKYCFNCGSYNGGGEE